MVRNLFVLLLLVPLSAFRASAAADELIVGRWSCTSTDERGTTADWELVVQSEDGKLSGTITVAGSGDVFDLIDPKLTGNTFSFKVRINPDDIAELIARTDGTKLEGKFKGESSGTGSFTGTRQK